MQQHPIGNEHELSQFSFQVIQREYRFRSDTGNFCGEADELIMTRETVHAWHTYADASYIYAELAGTYAARQQDLSEAPNRYAEILLQRTHRRLLQSSFVYFSRR
jgi:hypothetical protein